MEDKAKNGQRSLVLSQGRTGVRFQRFHVARMHVRGIQSLSFAWNGRAPRTSTTKPTVHSIPSPSLPRTRTGTGTSAARRLPSLRIPFSLSNSIFHRDFFPDQGFGSNRFRKGTFSFSHPSSSVSPLGLGCGADQRRPRRINSVRRDGVCAAFRHGQRSGAPRGRRRDPRQASAGTQVSGERNEARRSRTCSCTHVDGGRQRARTKRKRGGAHVADAGRDRTQEEVHRNEKRC